MRRRFVGLVNISVFEMSSKHNGLRRRLPLLCSANEGGAKMADYFYLHQGKKGLCCGCGCGFSPGFPVVRTLSPSSFLLSLLPCLFLVVEPTDDLLDDPHDSEGVLLQRRVQPHVRPQGLDGRVPEPANKFGLS